MSNPLLRPNDPRFQKPSIADSEGQNRFAEPEPLAAAGGGRSASQYASGGSESRPYQPKYEATQQGRAGLLMTIASLSLFGIVGGVLHLLGIFGTGTIAPLVAIVPAMTAWFLAHEDLKAIQQGALDPVHRPATRTAWWLAVLGFFGCAGLLAAMVYQQLDWLPSTF
jgi:hypothetical protein